MGKLYKMSDFRKDLDSDSEKVLDQFDKFRDELVNKIEGRDVNVSRKS